MQYTVKRIDEPDFGCEGRLEGQVVMDKVLLEDNIGHTQTVEVEDSLLYTRKIKEGNRVEIHPEYGMLKVVKVVAAVICDRMPEVGIGVRTKTIFATQRGYGEFKDGWEFPGGKVEPGETSGQALIREIREELDTEITVGDLISTVDYNYPTFHLTMDCFWAYVCRGNLELREHESAKWLTKETLHSVNWLPADRELINQIEEVME